MFLEWDGLLPSYDKRKSKMTSTVKYNLPYLYMPKITNVISDPSKLADLTKFYMDNHWYVCGLIINFVVSKKTFWDSPVVSFIKLCPI
jgi:hypothetical protein